MEELREAEDLNSVGKDVTNCHKEHKAVTDKPLNESTGENYSTKIFITNLPSGITSNGVRNLCLSAGNPISVYMCQNHVSAFVEFSKLKEAELALRDLNNMPPYFLKVSFAKSHGEKMNKINGSGYSQGTKGIKSGTDESWNVETFYKCYQKRNINEQQNFCKETLGRIAPYFSFHADLDDASLEMRQRYLDFKTEATCISQGRGYLYMGDVDRYKFGNSVYSLRSDDWKEINMNVQNCFLCGSLTFQGNRRETEIYCSSECQDDVSSFNKSTNISNSSVFDFFSPGKSGFIKILHDTRNIRFQCCIVLDCVEQYYDKIRNGLSGNNYEKIHRPNKGDMVIVQFRNRHYLRGLVLSNEDSLYKIALVDFGETISVKEAYIIDDSLKTISWFGGVATCTNECLDLNSVKFRIKRKKLFDSWLCDLIGADSGDVMGEIVLEKWFPPTNLTYVPLENGCTVIITTYKDMRTIFVRRTDAPWNEKFTRMSNDIAEYALEGRKYKKPPGFGDVCCARFKNDKCYYRAVVRSNNRQSINVDFLDYGNGQEIGLDDLTYLPSSARQINCFAVRVRLKGVIEASTPETVEYLNRLTAYGIELRLTYDSNNRREVILTEKSSGDNVNKIISDMVVPVWEVNPVIVKTEEPYFLESMNELSFAIGDTLDIYVLNVNDIEFTTSGCFWATTNRKDYLAHLNCELKQKITEYCKSLFDEPYIPRKGELCLVEVKGEWYRGVALEHEDKICDVALIDFGICCTVEPRNIRKILKQFLEMPALALKCGIVGHENWTEKRIQEVWNFLSSMVNKYIKNVKIINKIDNVYNLTLPLSQEKENEA